MKNNNNPMISIIVPVYNIASYIERCIESILAQTYSNIEIIAVDDGSTDDSGLILDSFAQNNKIRVYHIQNGGVTNARLYGVKHAKGEYIGFVDGDDVIEPEMYSRLMKNMQKKEADISHCGYQMVFNNKTLYFYNTGNLEKQDNLSGLIELLSGAKIEPALYNKLFRKSLFDDLLNKNLMELSIRENEDLLMNYYLFSKSKKSVYYDKCYYHYVVREGSSSNNKLLSKHKLEDPIRVQKILLKETKDEPQLQKIVYGRLIAMYSKGAEMELGEQPELIDPYRKMCRKELWKLLPKVLTGGYDYSSVIHALLATFCPWLCRKIHILFSKYKGTYEKYNIN